MFTAAPVIPLPMDHLTVHFPFWPRKFIAASARLAQAYSPLSSVPPNLKVISILSEQEYSMDAIASLNSRLTEVAAATGKLDERLAILSSPSGELSFAALTAFSNWASLGAHVTPGREWLFKRPEISKIMATLTSMGDSVTGKLVDGDWLSGEEQRALQLVTLWASFGRILKSFITAPQDVPAGSPRDLYPLYKRLQMSLALVVELQSSVSITGIRDKALFLRDPAISPLLEYVSKETREEIAFFGDFILALPLHPWLAAAARPSALARRATAYGTSNQTLGLSSLPDAQGMWHRLQTWRRARGDDSHPASDMRALLLDSSPEGFIKQFIAKARAMTELRGCLNPDYLRQARTVLELATPGAAPDVQLSGDKWRALVMTGHESSEAISDLWTLLMRPRFPLTRGDGSAGQLVGGTTAFDFDAHLWNEGATSPVYSHVTLARPPAPPLFVTPADKTVPESYSMGILTPEQIRPRTEGEFFGDTDAVFIPYTIDDLASHLGYQSVSALFAVPGMEAAVGHLFVKGEADKKWKPCVADCTMLFYSARTQQPWRKRVDVESRLPDATLSMDASSAPVAGHVRSTIIRTREYPVVMQDTLQVADALALTATLGLGWRKEA